MPKIKYPYIIALCIAVLFFYSCSEKNSTSSEQNQFSTGVLMPLAIGNTWIGRTRTLDSLGLITSETYDTLYINRAIGNLWYVCDSKEIMLKNDDKGYWEYYLNSDIVLQYIKYPCNIGEKMINDTLDIGEYGKTAIKVITGNELKNKDTSINTPAGTFSCYFYKSFAVKEDGSSAGIDAPFTPNLFVKPNIGIIKAEMYDYNDQANKTKFVWELISYKLN